MSRRAADGPQDDLSREYPVLLNPCVDRPVEHLDIAESGILRGRTSRGATTIELLSLNRAELVEKRSVLLLRSGLQERRLFNPEEVRTAAPAMLRPGQPFRGIIIDCPLRSASGKPSVHGLASAGVISGRHSPRDCSYRIQTGPVGRSGRSIPYALRQASNAICGKSRLRTFKGIRHLVLDFPEEGKRIGKAAGSLAVLGDNGTGKTSVLQATALAAMGLNRAREDTLKPSDCVAHDAQAGKIVLRFRDTDKNQ